jgi:hypothetical protein
MIEDYPRLTPARIVSTLNDHPHIYLSGSVWHERYKGDGDRKDDIRLGPVSFLLASEKGLTSVVEVYAGSAGVPAYVRERVSRLLGTPEDYLKGLLDGFVDPDGQFDLMWGDYAIGFIDGNVAADLIEGIDPEREAS